ncbi:hypothetical protein [Oceanobacillus polygoni]|uniref:Uncharacterized protein n=1 Tax=Oceanobacillus polygoni TaxID=1235259 RepID=A0A9X0YS23_9BACI|nr:hypothetical protein [Oceanobacillus polygoni]MBP2077017.1 hypothetical protein [Oceanobacillus polygoni]
MMWIRFIILGFFSLTALSVFFYQGIETAQALKEYFSLNKYL